MLAHHARIAKIVAAAALVFYAWVDIGTDWKRYSHVTVEGVNLSDLMIEAISYEPWFARTISAHATTELVVYSDHEILPSMASIRWRRESSCDAVFCTVDVPIEFYPQGIRQVEVEVIVVCQLPDGRWQSVAGPRRLLVEHRRRCAALTDIHADRVRWDLAQKYPSSNRNYDTSWHKCKPLRGSCLTEDQRAGGAPGDELDGE